LRTRNIGRHQVRRELDTAELQLERLRERRDQKRLRQAGDTDQQRMPIRQERDQEPLHDGPLTNDPLPDLGLDLRPYLREPLEKDHVPLGRLRLTRNRCFHAVSCTSYSVPPNDAGTLPARPARDHRDPFTAGSGPLPLRGCDVLNSYLPRRVVFPGSAAWNDRHGGHGAGPAIAARPRPDSTPTARVPQITSRQRETASPPAALPELAKKFTSRYVTGLCAVRTPDAEGAWSDAGRSQRRRWSRP